MKAFRAVRRDLLWVLALALAVILTTHEARSYPPWGGTNAPTASGAGGLTAPVLETRRTVTVSTTLDNPSSDYDLWLNPAAPITITLPTPTAGRVITMTDVSGALETNNVTLARSAAESINGIAASRVQQTNWGKWTITSDGTNWYVQGSGRQTRALFTASGTWTPPSGITEALFIGWGGGGGGGSGAEGAAATDSPGGGGGGGAQLGEQFCKVTPNTGVVVTIGAGGAGGAAVAAQGAGNPGKDGGTTTTTNTTPLVTFIGGAGGQQGPATDQTFFTGTTYGGLGGVGFGSGNTATSASNLMFNFTPIQSGSALAWVVAGNGGMGCGSTSTANTFGGPTSGTPNLFAGGAATTSATLHSGSGGGGGGGAGNVGGAGAAGGAAGAAGGTAAPNSGGGGGGGNGIPAGASGAGGGGGGGQLAIIYVD